MKKFLFLAALSCLSMTASAEVTPLHKHVYTIKGAFSGPTYRPIYFNSTANRFKSADGENGATPQKFVFFSSPYTNNAGLETFKVGVVEGDGYLHYDPNNNGKVTKANAASVAFPTSSTTLSSPVVFENNGVAEGYNGMIGLGGSNTYRSYVVQNNTNINYNTRSNGKVYASSTLGATNSWQSNFLIEEVSGYDVYDVAFENAPSDLTTVSYTGSDECLTTAAQPDGGYFVLATGASKTAADFNNTPATVSVDEDTKTITFTFPESVTVTYTIVHNGQTLGTVQALELRGAAPTVAFPSYVKASNLPTTVETDAYTVNTTYNSTMPFEIDKRYYLQFIVSGSGTFWWYNNDAAKELKDNGPESGNEARAQWVIGGDWLNGFTFQSKYDDKYLTSPTATSTNVQAQLTTNATDLSRFELLHKTGTYTGFYFKVKNGTACLAHTSASDLNLSMWNDATYRGNIVTFVKVPESFDVTVSDAGYATLYYGEALTIPSGVKAYTIKVEDDYAVATEITGTIPSKTAVVLQAEKSTYTFPTTLHEAFDGENDLQGTLVATATPTGCCTLAVEEGIPGFYSYTGDTVVANKAYYIASSEAASNLRIVFDNDTLTSIITAAQENGGQAIYDLQGRRVVKTQNGLNIVNGKKVIK